MKVKFDRFKNLTTGDIFYALNQDAVVRKIDGCDYIEVTPDFKRAHMVLRDSLMREETVEINL